MAQAAWRDKAEWIIAADAKDAYERANRLPNGRLRKKHMPYTISDRAEQLVKCLGNNDEEAAKAIFQVLAVIPEFGR